MKLERDIKKPRHVGIIMDGNGRWAEARSLPRLAGHRQGAESLKKIVRYAGEKKIDYLTLFAFSLENWNRPDEEVKGLMDMMRRYLKSETADLKKNNARIRVIGDRARLAQDIQDSIQSLEDETQNNEAITIVLALSYGGRDEIAKAAQALAEKVQQGSLQTDQIDADMLGAHLMTADMPDPDLIIRTSGEKRISNFLLWQSAYAEYYFSDKMWPDFGIEDFDKALEDFANRSRRFGGLTSDATRDQKKAL